MTFDDHLQGWSAMPAVPLATYKTELGGALDRLATYQGPLDYLKRQGITSEGQVTSKAIVAALQNGIDQQNRIQESIRYLENIRPDKPELLQMHVRAIGYLRCYLTFLDRNLKSTVASIRGDEREARNYGQEADQWTQWMLGAQAEFSQDLLYVREHHPWTFTSLHLQTSTLTELGLM